MFGTTQMDVNTNMYVSEAAIPQIVAIRYCTLEKKTNTCPTFSVSRLRAAVCRISAHSCPSYTSLAFALFSFLLIQSTTKLPLKHGPKTTYFFNSSEAKSRKNVPPPPAGASGAASGAPPSPAAGGGRGRSEAATGFGFTENTSALVWSSVLAYDANSIYCTG